MERRKALLIGNNKYKNVSKLSGCINDVTGIKELLEKHGKGDPNFSVRTLKNGSNQKMKSAIEELLNEKRAPEVALLYYSGHGYVDEDGGYLCGVDAAKNDVGISMSWLGAILNKSKIREITVILDCCHAGSMLELSSEHGLTNIREGVTILAATTSDDVSVEFCGKGIFTSILIDGLGGAAADILGHVTAVGLYNNAESLLSPWQQTPVFKSSVSRLTPLRYCLPPVRKRALRLLANPELFPSKDSKIKLNKSLMNDSSIVEGSELSMLMILSGFDRAGLLTVKDRKPFLQAILDGDDCSLSPYGEHFWELVKNKRI